MPEVNRSHLPGEFAMSRSRTGFTLIEILVVITVISLLMALFIVGSFWVVGYAREAKTKAIIATLSLSVEDRTKAFREVIEKNPLRSNGREMLQGVLRYETDAIAGDASLSTMDKTAFQNRLDAMFSAMFSRIDSCSNMDKQIETILSHREFFRMFFPQNWDDAEFLLVKARLPKVDVSKRLNNENSEVLLWTITKAKAVGTQQADIDAIPASNIMDIDGNGLPEVVDAWNNPIQYIRWPARLLRPDGISASYTAASGPPAIPSANTALAQAMFGNLPPNLLRSNDDPLDKVGVDSGKSPLDVETAYFLPGTFWQSIIFSAGADGETGLENPKSGPGYWGKPSDASKVYDNITGANLKVTK